MLSVDFVILDFDGVLTDNRVYVFEDGREAVACNRADGWGIRQLREAKIEVIILSTEANPVVSMRAKKLGIECIQQCDDKKSAVVGLIEKHSLDPSRVMYVGNDTNDLEAMRLVGHRVAPADAHPVIRSIATTVVAARGGEGVVREIADALLEQQQG